VLYGTTLIGRSGQVCTFDPYIISGCGTGFQLTPPTVAGEAWTETVIYSFTGANSDGALPTAAVVVGKGAVLYGTTQYGGLPSTTCNSEAGAIGCGTVFALTPPPTTGGVWTESVLHSFMGENGEGANPETLTLSSTGVLYGPTGNGGSAGHGTIFTVTP